MALCNWIELCSESLRNGEQFELYDGEPICIKINDKIDLFNFAYLVNYLTYPDQLRENVKGKMVVCSNKFPEYLMNKRALVLVPKSEQDVDNVHFIFENGEQFKFDMGGRVTQVESSINYERIEVDLISYSDPEIFYSTKTRKAKARYLTEEQRLRRRFEIGITAFYTALVTCGIFVILEDDSFVFFIGLTFIYFFWLYYDFKILQHSYYFNHLIILAILYLIAGRIIANYISFPKINVIAVLPFIMLVLQRISRPIYKTVIHREPEINYQIKNFSEFVYSMILLVGSIMLSVLINLLQ